MQPSENQLNSGNFVLWVDVYRHTPTVVDYFNRSIGVDTDLDFSRVTGDGLIDTVIHHLLNQMVRSSGIGVHTWAAAHGLKTREHLQ
tara:strand:- start:508 stop:768 length:261 start_codon:yes stop_codon:yes gene_type:complete